MNRSNTIQEILYFCDTDLCDIWEVNGPANHWLDEQVKHHPRDTLFLWHYALWYLRSKQSCKSPTGWTGQTHPRLLLALVIICRKQSMVVFAQTWDALYCSMLTLLTHSSICRVFFWGGGGEGGEHVSMEPGCLVQVCLVQVWVSVCSWSGAGHGVHPG